MKKVVLIFLVSILAYSCSSDDDNSNNPSQDDIIGVWTLKSIENQGIDNAVLDCQTQQTVTYSSNNNGGEFFPEDTLATPCEFNTTQFNWSRSDDQLTKDVNGEGNFMSQILLLNETQLQTVTIEINGVVVPEDEREIFKYEK